MAKFLNERYLLDTFEIKGNSIEDFETIVLEVDEHTEYLHLNLKNMKLVSFLPKSKEDFGKDKILDGYLIDPAKSYRKGKFEEARFDTMPYLKAGLECQIEEMRTKNRSQMIDASSGDMYFMSTNVYNTLAQRLDCDGKSLSHASLGRDHLIADRIRDVGKTNLETTMVVKTFRGAVKAFACMSKTYGEAQMSILSAIIDYFANEEALGRPTCMDYVVNHKLAHIRIQFDDYANEISTVYGLKDQMTPYMTLMTSSIGEGSIVAKGGWITGTGTLVPEMEYHREHRGTIDSDKVIKAVKETVFDKFVSMPERLVELMGVQLTPSGCDLSTPIGRAENHEVIMSIFKWIFKKQKVADILGIQRTDELLNLIDFASIDDGKVYDAYDIAMECFKLPEQLRAYLTEAKMGEITQIKLTNAFSKVPYLEFESQLRSEGKGVRLTFDPKSVYLTPAV